MDKIIVDNLVAWIKNYVENSGCDGVVIGMSGGKDSYVSAGLCVKALGKEKVFGLIMPNGTMKDHFIAEDSCKSLGIKYDIIDIKDIYNIYIDNVKKICPNVTTVSTVNIPPRTRMTMLYAVAGSLNYLVVNTSNLSEKEVGYTTKWGG